MSSKHPKAKCSSLNAAECIELGLCSTSTFTTRSTYLPSWLHGKKIWVRLVRPLSF